MSATEPAAVAETPDLYGAYPRLSEGQIERLAERGERRATEAGEVLFREGDEGYDFHAIVAGRVAVVQGQGPDERLIAVHGPGRFLGEVSLLTGQPSFLTAIVREAGEVLVVPVDELRDLVARDSALGDLILRAFLMRRSILIGLGAGIRIVGSRYSRDARRLREFAARNRIPHRWIDVEKDPEAEALLRELGIAPEETPVVVWRGEQVLRNPAGEELARVLGLPASHSDDAICDLVVVGSGPAGLAAAVYGASEGLATVALDAVAMGGQAGTSSRIENYLGFPSGISGGELAERAVIQAEKFGARLSVPSEASGFEQRDGHFAVRLDGDGNRLVEGRAVLMTTGVHYLRLPVERLDEFEAESVYYAATEAEALMCAGDPVAVVGGGNSAGQAALFLSRHVPVVRLLAREDDLTRCMSRYLIDQVENAPRIEVMLNTEVRELVGDDGVLEQIVVEDNRDGERRTISAKAVFVFIGAEPHTGWLGGRLELDERGFILTGAAMPGCRLLETSLPGVFAAGDVRSGSIKRVASAVGEGSMAVRLVHEYLADRHSWQQPGQT